MKIWNPSSSGECLKTLKGHRWLLFAKRCMLTPHLRPMHVHRGRGVDSGGERRRRPQHMCSLTIQKIHRGRGVEQLTKNLTFEKMAALGLSPASSSTQRTHRRSSVGRTTVQSRCGTCQTANASRLSPDIGEPPLRSVACLPRSPGERRRAVN